MNIISSCKMGPGTFEAKFIPLSQVKRIEMITVLRKTKGPQINKVIYKTLPRLFSKYGMSIFIAPFLLIKYVKKTNAKLIIAYHAMPHVFYAYFASKITGIPYIFGQTGLNVQYLTEKWFLGRIILHVVKKATIINVPGLASKNFWISKGVDPNKINLLHSTIDTEIFTNTNSKIEYDLIYLGRLSGEKNLELLLNSLVNLNNKGCSLKMVVVGEGPERNKLEKFVKSNNLENNVSFVGFQFDVNSWLNKAAIFAMSSWSEGMPTALMQAMACERICICSKVGNIPDLLIHEENGFLFESYNLGELTSLLYNVYNNRKEYSQLRKNARLAVINNHSHLSALKKWETLFSEIFDNN